MDDILAVLLLQGDHLVIKVSNFSLIILVESCWFQVSGGAWSGDLVLYFVNPEGIFYNRRWCRTQGLVLSVALHRLHQGYLLSADITIVRESGV